MKFVRQKDSRELKETQGVVKKSNKEQGMGDVLIELVWGDFKIPKGAMELKNTLCQIIPFWRYWSRPVPQW